MIFVVIIFVVMILFFQKDPRALTSTSHRWSPVSDSRPSEVSATSDIALTLPDISNLTLPHRNIQTLSNSIPPTGNRVPDGFGDRTLPHFDHNERSPAAKGFVE